MEGDLHSVFFKPPVKTNLFCQNGDEGGNSLWGGGGAEGALRCPTVYFVVQHHLRRKQLVLCKFHGFVRCVNLSDQTLDFTSSKRLELLMRPISESPKGVKTVVSLC